MLSMLSLLAADAKRPSWRSRPGLTFIDNMAMINNAAMIVMVAVPIANKAMSNQRPIPPKGSARVYEGQGAGLFGSNGWEGKVHPSLGNQQADLIVAQNGFHYIVELKTASEGRRDRLVPLLAQAVLQAHALTKASPEPAFPLAVIAAPVISPSVIIHL